MIGARPTRRHLLALLTAVAAIAAGPCSAETEHVVVVLDVSADMWLPLRDEVPRLAAAREALLAAALQLPPRGPERRLAVRLMGSDTTWSDDASCSDTRLLPPFASPDHDLLRSELALLVPGGRRPLVEALVAAVADLPPGAGPRRIILVLAGDDDCDADKRRAVAALSSSDSPIELRIVGVSMPHEAAGRYAKFAPTKNAGTLPELHEALRWAFLDDDAERAPRGELELELTGDALTAREVRVHVVPTGETEGFVLRPEGGGRFRSRVDAGRHVLRVVDVGTGATVVELGGVTVAAGEESRLHLDLPVRLPVTVEPLPAEGVPPGQASVAWHGAPEGPLVLTVTSTEAPIATSLVRRRIVGTTGTVDLPLPIGLRNLEARVLEEAADGVWRLLGRAELAGDQPWVSLEVPSTAETDATLDLRWSGSPGAGDRLLLEPVDGSGRSVCMLAGRAGPARLATPGTAGAYRLHYVEGLTGRSLASRNVELILIEARLRAPTSVTAGGELEVGWEGPGNAHDFLTVVPAGAADTDYRSHVSVGSTPPTRLVAPEDPGPHEVRYVEGASGRVLARAPLDVIPVEVVLDVPATVPADRRFTVRWRGPAADGDLVTVAPVGSLPMRMLDWTPLSMGNPLTLAAPGSPGRYEVRYVSTTDRTVRASVEIEVVP